MKICITGIAGFVGSNLAEKLNNDGYEVVGIDSFEDYYSPIFKRHTAKILEKQDIKVYELNLCKDSLSNALDGVDVVYHLAAQPGNDAKTPFENYVNNKSTSLTDIQKKAADLTNDGVIKINDATEILKIIKDAKKL